MKSLLEVAMEFKVLKHEDKRGWFVVSESGAIIIDGCADLDAAILARQKLLTRLRNSIAKRQD